MKRVLEVCVDSVESAIAAQKGGASRIELCGDLIVGGVTPGLSLYRLIRKYTEIEIRVMIRPRFGDFCYTAYEYEQMKEEVRLFAEEGADGIVMGILYPDGTLDVERMRRLIDLARESRQSRTAVTFHRAFDVCREPEMALEQCVEMGVDTILTSGQQNSAWKGRELIKKLVELSDGRIEILAGAGITPEVIEKLAAYSGGGAYHMSGKKVIDSQMLFRKDGVNMGLPGFSEYEIWRTEDETIDKARKKLFIGKN